MILLDKGQYNLAIESFPLPDNQHVAQPVAFVINLLHCFVLGHFIEKVDFKLLLLL